MHPSGQARYRSSHHPDHRTDSHSRRCAQTTSPQPLRPQGHLWVPVTRFSSRRPLILVNSPPRTSGLFTWRFSTKSWWRSTMISTSLASSERSESTTSRTDDGDPRREKTTGRADGPWASWTEATASHTSLSTQVDAKGLVIAVDRVFGTHRFPTVRSEGGGPPRRIGDSVRCPLGQRTALPAPAGRRRLASGS